MSRDIELKPCPFCGVMPKPGADGDLWIIGCENRECDISPVAMSSISAEAAATYWNKRSPALAVPAPQAEGGRDA